ncbi:ABZJ_00895 family protein [Piscinibacter koreensis]|uniref:Uncharacterized protein n=1 Tax=Piscinibacter koreensis TaxID=2742824 RepID=A0A7Y6TVA1_9BURK|nr:ABZJ_00895 family protein [Schlegelella koreensis]NUZ04835.1 hypothetical protein [Schlegelella koreensis]
MKKYTAVYLLAYVLCSVAVGLLAEMLKAKGGSAFNLAAGLGAAFIAAHVFVRDHARGPTPAERISFARQAIGATWALGLLAAAVVFLAVLPWSQAKLALYALRLPIVLAVAVPVLVVGSLVYYVAVRWAFGWYGRRSAEGGSSGLEAPGTRRRPA